MGSKLGRARDKGAEKINPTLDMGEGHEMRGRLDALYAKPRSREREEKKLQAVVFS